LIGQGLVVRNRTREPLCENCIRITVGTEQENKALIRAMRVIENKRIEQ
jgi:histidinol-phosphate aminotransferase